MHMDTRSGPDAGWDLDSTGVVRGADQHYYLCFLTLLLTSSLFDMTNPGPLLVGKPFMLCWRGSEYAQPGLVPVIQETLQADIG